MRHRSRPSSIAMLTDRLVVVAIAVVTAMAASSCGRDDGQSSSPATPTIVEPTPITVSPDAPGLVYRYVDGDSGKVATAMSIDAIPAASRAQVVVFDPATPTPAGWEHVVDLSAAESATTVPTRGFVLQPARPPSTVVAASSQSATSRRGRVGAHEVVMFSTQGCGYCRKARKWFDGQKVPYSEYDLERDAKAPARLAQLAQAAGVGQEQLGGVPVIFVDGKPVLGWDARRVKGLLGR